MGSQPGQIVQQTLSWKKKTITKRRGEGGKEEEEIHCKMHNSFL
jgi:hypothetical protein